MTTAHLIFACLVSLIHPPAPVQFPVILHDSHYLSMHRRWGNFNEITQEIIVRDGLDLSDEDLSTFDRHTLAHEFARYLLNKKHWPQSRVPEFEALCYWPEGK